MDNWTDTNVDNPSTLRPQLVTIEGMTTDQKDTQHWAVIGGGMLGLTLALRLAQQGQRVTVLEVASQVGGLAGAWKIGDVTWDQHYHVILLSDTHLRKLLREIGLENEMQWVETKTGFYADGHLYSMSNLEEFLTFPLLTLWERIRLGSTIFLISRIRNWRRLEKIPVASWLRRWSGRGVWKKVWRPLLRAKLGDAYTRTSAAFIWAHTQRMYKARSLGGKKEMFGYVRGGYARILQCLTEALVQEGVEIQCNAMVSRTIRERDGHVMVQLDNGRQQMFDQVVYTVPAPIVAETCPQLINSERQQFQGVEYLGIVCSSVLLKKPLTQYYVTNIIDESVSFTAVIEMTAIVNLAELDGFSLVYLPKYAMVGDAVFNESDSGVQERCLSTLEKMYPDFTRADVVAFRTSRVRYLMALPTLNYSKRLPPMRTSIPGIWTVSSAHILKGNLNVNETIQVAEQALRNVLMPPVKRFGSAGLGKED